MSTFQYEVENNVAHLTIQSPPANALSTQIVKDLDAELTKVEEDQSVKAVIIKGDGRFFSAGADIKEFTVLENTADSERLARNGQAVFKRLEDFSIPVIAAIHGAALGGGLELAMACHMRIVSEDAKLGLPELNLGIIPGFAGTQRLPQYVGTAKAYEMILTAAPITGVEAVKIGLANKAVVAEEVFNEATKLAENIAAKSKPTINRIMALMNYSRSQQFIEGQDAEVKAFTEVFATEDAKEGIQAFLEKRKAKFQDK